MSQELIHWQKNNLTGPSFLETLPTIIPQQLHGVNPLRATVLTLGLYVKGINPRQWHDLSADIARSHPARVLVIDPDPGEADGATLDAEVHAAVRRPVTEGQTPLLYSECVEMHLKGPLASYWIDWVQPLVHAELPSYLWWIPAPPGKDFRWDLLATSFDHLIIDTKRCGVDAWLPNLVPAMTEGLLVDDLLWLRLAPWRELVASLADDADMLRLLRSPSQIQVACPRETKPAIESILMWLAHLLEWPDKHPWSGDEGAWTESATPTLHVTQGSEGFTLSEDHPGMATFAPTWGEPSTHRVELLSVTECLIQLFDHGHDTLYQDILQGLTEEAAS